MNIVVPSKAGDFIHNEVAINTFPIVWVTEADTFSTLLEDNEFKTALTNLVRSKNVYDDAIIYYRSFDDDSSLVEEDHFKLKDKIKLELK